VLLNYTRGDVLKFKWMENISDMERLPKYSLILQNPLIFKGKNSIVYDGYIFEEKMHDEG